MVARQALRTVQACESREEPVACGVHIGPIVDAEHGEDVGSRVLEGGQLQTAPDSKGVDNDGRDGRGDDKVRERRGHFIDSQEERARGVRALG